ncbi:subtilisin-like serine protease [Medicago truncatula]|uniref:Subtilisin-like serine protease n=1 Tax=Medicago truncatula TaxID=3880 RepID=A0A072U3Z8_MEDTR|nr:subtilisin-like serine protease [Medicago truncatula]
MKNPTQNQQQNTNLVSKSKVESKSKTKRKTRHITGLVALIKQKFPNFSPADIGYALSTTASQNDKSGGPIMAQQPYAFPDLSQTPPTSFNMGSGFVNAAGELNMGLI